MGIFGRNSSNYEIISSDTFCATKDVISGMPIITMIGYGELYIENYKAIMEFQSDRIKILTKRGILCITGCNLDICYMDVEEISISGRIQEIIFEQ